MPTVHSSVLPSKASRPVMVQSSIGTVSACALAGCIGLAYAMLVFGWDFFDQNSVYWQRPVGLAGGPFDLKNNLTGYFWIVQDIWRWPLLWLPYVDTPMGINAYQFDSMPGLALFAKVMHSLSLGTINLYPEWIVGVFVLNAISLNLLVRALGQRSFLACIVSAGFGILAPIVHYRFGHSALMAQFFPILALALYFEAGKISTTVLRYLVPLLVLCFVVATINLYMYVMTAAITVAAIVQLMLARRLGVTSGIASFIGLLLAAFIPIWAFGAFADPNLRAVTVPFGYNSMNLMSPFWPQSSGLFGWTGSFYLTRGLIGATPGQWEGYAYLGAGAVLLLVLALVLRARALPSQIRRHWTLVFGLVVLALWAVSNHIYLGPVQLASYPVPQVLENTVLAWFRASGRFFWPVGWMATAYGIATVLAALRPRVAVVVTAVTLLLQWGDVSYLRHRIEAAVSSPAPSQYGSQENADRIAHEIAARGRLVVLPSYSCLPGAFSSDGRDDLKIAVNEAEYMAARANVDVRHPKGSRPAYQCDTERTEDLAAMVGGGVLINLPSGAPDDRTEEVRRTFSCWQANVAWLCTAKSAAVH